jgi:hypothetical protein
VSGSLIRLLLRALSIAIAVAALVDPVFSRSTSHDRPIVAIHLTAGPSPAIDSALRELLMGRELTTRVPVGPRLPCAIDEDCVVIADGSIDSDWEAGRPVSLITADLNTGPNVRVQSVMLSGGHRSVAGAARVVLAGRDVAGKRTEVRISDSGAVVGSATHQWSTATAATIEIPWWPLDPGVRALRIEAIPFDGESTAIDNVIDLGATIATARLPILVFDARPSWNSTFVRRALEDDARFAVEYRSRIAPALSAGTPRGRINAAVLDKAAAVIVGAPDALTAEEAAWLDRYVRVRGGTLVLLPERTAVGASAHLFPANGTEHLSANAESVGALHATEILRWSDVPVTATVIAMSELSPSIVSIPAGNGRIVVSGAMDAWRYRDLDSGAFDRFWTSLVAQGAALGDGLQLMFEEGIAPRGSRARFVVRDRRLEPLAIVEASAVVHCKDETRVARLWPAGALGEFVGEVSAARQGECTVDAMVGDRRASGSVAIVDQPARGTELTLAKLERQARASGGMIAAQGEMQNVARALAAATPALSRVVSVNPLRDPWWILPFAGCLSAEWWLRRRNGLR